MRHLSYATCTPDEIDEWRRKRWDINDTEMIDYTSFPDLGSVCGHDAAKWADAMMQVVSKHGWPIDLSEGDQWGWVQGWFANAICWAADNQDDRKQ